MTYEGYLGVKLEKTFCSAVLKGVVSILTKYKKIYKLLFMRIAV